jgi:hypothetical protein
LLPAPSEVCLGREPALLCSYPLLLESLRPRGGLGRLHGSSAPSEICHAARGRRAGTCDCRRLRAVIVLALVDLASRTDEPRMEGHRIAPACIAWATSRELRGAVNVPTSVVPRVILAPWCPCPQARAIAWRSASFGRQ